MVEQGAAPQLNQNDIARQASLSQQGGGKTNIFSMFGLIAGVNMNLENAEILPISSVAQQFAPDECCCFFKTMSFNCPFLDDFFAQLKEALNRSPQELGMSAPSGDLGQVLASMGVSAEPSQDLVGRGILPPEGIADDFHPEQKISNGR